MFRTNVALAQKLILVICPPIIVQPAAAPRRKKGGRRKNVESKRGALLATVSQEALALSLEMRENCILCILS